MYVVQKRHRGDVFWLYWFESSKYDEVLKQMDYYKSVLPSNIYEYRILHAFSQGVI